MRQLIAVACTLAAALAAWGMNPVASAKGAVPGPRHAVVGAGQLGRIWHPPHARLKSAGGPPTAAHGISVALVPDGRRFVSGAMLPASVVFRDRSKLPFSLAQLVPAYCTLRFGGTFGPHRAALNLTAHGQADWGFVALIIFGNYAPNIFVPPGGSLALRAEAGGRTIFVGRYLDATLPGTYRLQVETKYGVRRVPGIWAAPARKPGALAAKLWNRRKFVKLGPHLALGQDNISWVPRRPHGRLRSKWVKIRIMPPYGGHRSTAITPAGAGAPPVGAKAKPGLHILLADPDVKGPGPITVRAFLEYNGHRPMALRLAGDPQTDFAVVQVTGPSITGEVVMAKFPKPHEVPYIRKRPPPFTAYGKWLLKHPPKKLPEKSYTLKPGVVYKYAVPINLSCQYDMSRSGTYRVRVELAHPKVWSNWIKVKMPQYSQ